MMEINEDIYGLEKSVLHKLILIQYIFPIIPGNLSLIIQPEEKWAKAM